MHNNPTIISQMCSSGCFQRSSEANRSDSRYLTLIQLCGSMGLGGIFHSSQIHCILKMGDSTSASHIFTYSLIKHGAHRYDIVTTAKHAHKVLNKVISLLICALVLSFQSFFNTNNGYVIP